VATLGSTAFEYDGNGNLLADSAHAYAWGADNRLIGIAGTANGAPLLSHPRL
jgi:hypothetical protein